MVDVFCVDSAWAPSRHENTPLEQVSKSLVFEEREAFNFLLTEVPIFWSPAELHVFSCKQFSRVEIRIADFSVILKLYQDLMSLCSTVIVFSPFLEANGKITFYYTGVSSPCYSHQEVSKEPVRVLLELEADLLSRGKTYSFSSC